MNKAVDPGLRIRPMTEKDLPAVIDIEQRAHPFPWTEGIFRDCLRVGYICRVLEQRRRIIAYGVMSVAAGEAHIFNVCVEPKAQRHGLGYRIMHHLIDDARQRRAASVFLEVRPSNTPALRLYDKLGFNEIGIRKAYYPAANGGREDALILALHI